MIDVVWYDAARGNWDSGLLCEIFDKHPDTFVQHNEKEIKLFSRAIVIVVGRPEVERLYKYLSMMESGIVILTSEEDGFFDWRSAIPKHLQIWTQYFTASKEPIKERLLLGAPNRIKDYKINSHLPKKYLWSFIGQIQNTHRQKMIEVIKTLPDGFLHITDLFGGEGEKGVDYQSYLDIMCQSKYVVCGAGSMSADSFRIYESILCDSIPITEKRCQRDKPDFNYWSSVYPDNRILCVDDWGELTEETLRYCPEGYTQEVNSWWFDYKNKLEQKLLNIANGTN